MNSKELLLGLILVKDGKLTRDQLKKALLKQGEVRRFGRHQRLGEVIVKLGMLTEDDLNGILDIQNGLLMQAADHTPLGLLVIERGYAQPSQVYDTLNQRQFRESRLGELLIEQGLLTEAQLVELLEVQLQERETARAGRAAAGIPEPEPGQAGGPALVEDDFVILDAGGDDGDMLPFNAFAAVPQTAPADAGADLLFKSYLED